MLKNNGIMGQNLINVQEHTIRKIPTMHQCICTTLGRRVFKIAWNTSILLTVQYILCDDLIQRPFKIKMVILQIAGIFTLEKVCVVCCILNNLANAVGHLGIQSIQKTCTLCRAHAELFML